MPPCGLLNLDKPGGMTSREAVNCLQRLLPRKTKIGHAGTLDPLASGVLVVCVGAATRLIEYVQQMPKHYTAVFLLGRESPTEDVEGEVAELDNPPIPSRDQIVAATRQLTGSIRQRPPAFSAIKVQGRRAYDLARAGRPVELPSRPVTVYRLDVPAYDYPRLVLNIECGSGTYVRSLGRDLADSLRTAAVMAELTRTAIGGFSISRAVDPRGLDRENWTDHLLPPLLAVRSLPRVELSAEEVVEIGHGRTIPDRSDKPRAEQYAAVDPSGRLVAILVPRDQGRLGPIRNLA